MKLTITGTTIRQNDRGLFSLVDLHRASGEEQRHLPNRWLRNAKTKEEIEFLISEVDHCNLRESVVTMTTTTGDFSEQGFLLRESLSAGNPATNDEHSDNANSGVIEVRQNTGAWVCLDLVYSYAMWISPKFKFKVIRAYHAMMTRPRIQHEKALTERYEFYPKLRDEVLQGHTDTQIAPVIGRSAGSVGYHRNKQFTDGYTDPVEYAHKRYSPAVAQKVIAKRGWNKWGSDYESTQASFEFEFGETK